MEYSANKISYFQYSGDYYSETVKLAPKSMSVNSSPISNLLSPKWLNQKPKYRARIESEQWKHATYGTVCANAYGKSSPLFSFIKLHVSMRIFHARIV